MLYLLLFISGLFWAVLGLGYKVADHYRCRTAGFARIMFVTSGLICVIVAGVVEQTAWGDWRLWALGLSAGVMFFLVLLLLMPAYRLGPASVVWIVVNLGTLVPILLSPLFHERLYWFFDPLLLGLFVLMLLAFQRGMAQAKETTPATGMLFLLVLLAVFLTNGILLAAPKWQSIMFDGANRLGYLAIFYLGGAASTLVADLLRKESLPPTRNEWKAGLLGGVSGAVGMLLFMAVIRLPAAVVYAANGGVSLLGGVLLTTLIYRERLNALKITGLALGLIVLLTAVLRMPLVEKLQRMPAFHAIIGASLDYGQSASEKPAE
jgi:drug/metabolite transporter (DMT)-like permease